jgi:hypothetical protein
VSDLEVRLLGPFEVIVAGKAADVPGAKRQALVAFLALRVPRSIITPLSQKNAWPSPDAVVLFPTTCPRLLIA